MIKQNFGMKEMGVGSQISLYVTEHEIVFRHTPYALVLPFERIRCFKIKSIVSIFNTEKSEMKELGILDIVIPGSAEDSQDLQLKTDKTRIFFDVATDLNNVKNIKKYIDDYLQK